MTSSNNSVSKVVFSREYLIREHYGDRTFTHAPYGANLHDPESDEMLGQFISEDLKNCLYRIPDRSPIRITVEVISPPETHRPRWVLIEPHIYGPETIPAKESST